MPDGNAAAVVVPASVVVAAAAFRARLSLYQVSTGILAERGTAAWW